MLKFDFKEMLLHVSYFFMRKMGVTNRTRIPYVAHSLDEIREILKKEINKEDELLIRGHAISNYQLKLSPSLYRTLKSINFDSVGRRNDEFCKNLAQDFQGNSFFTICENAQQIFNESCLLDVTDSVEIATFFACSGYDRYNGDFIDNKKDGEILLIGTKSNGISKHELNIDPYCHDIDKFQDNLSDIQKKGCFLFSPAKYDCESTKKYCGKIMDSLDDFLNNRPERHVGFGNWTFVNPCAISQRNSFLYGNVNDMKNLKFISIKIPYNKKKIIMEELRKIGIDDSFVFNLDYPFHVTRNIIQKNDVHKPEMSDVYSVINDDSFLDNRMRNYSPGEFEKTIDHGINKFNEHIGNFNCHGESFLIYRAHLSLMDVFSRYSNSTNFPNNTIDYIADTWNICANCIDISHKNHKSITTHPIILLQCLFFMVMTQMLIYNIKKLKYCWEMFKKNEHIILNIDFEEDQESLNRIVRFLNWMCCYLYDTGQYGEALRTSKILCDLMNKHKFESMESYLYFLLFLEKVCSGEFEHHLSGCGSDHTKKHQCEVSVKFACRYSRSIALRQVISKFNI